METAETKDVKKKRVTKQEVGSPDPKRVRFSQPPAVVETKPVPEVCTQNNYFLCSVEVLTVVIVFNLFECKTEFKGGI